MSPVVIDDPAAAAAAGLCVAARSLNTTIRHPRRCAWCDYPVDVLGRMVEGFNEWVAYNQRTGTFMHEVVQFTSLPRADQIRLVTAAQEIDPEPMRPAATAPAHEPEPEAVDWMTQDGEEPA